MKTVPRLETIRSGMHGRARSKRSAVLSGCTNRVSANNRAKFGRSTMNQRSPWNEAEAKAIITAHQARGLLPVLSALNETFGYVHKDAVGLCAHALNLSRAEVHGVASFYHDFRERPPGKHVLKLCGAEACQSMGGDELAEHVARELGICFGETTPDESV